MNLNRRNFLLKKKRSKKKDRPPVRCTYTWNIRKIPFSFYEMLLAILKMEKMRGKKAQKEGITLLNGGKSINDVLFK